MKKVFLSGLVAVIVMFAVGMILGLLCDKLFPSMQQEYSNTGVFRPMTDPRMSLLYVAMVIQAFVLAWIWNKSKSLFHGNVWCNGFCLSLVFIAISTVPGMIITYGCFVISLPMILTWTLSSVFQAYFGSVVICRMNS